MFAYHPARCLAVALAAVTCLAIAMPAFAAAPVPNKGDTAFMILSSVLVLLMTIPGLALFYGGLVRKKNVLSVLAQCLGITGLVSILWWAFGYSFVFGDGAGPILGNMKFAFLKGVDSNPNTNYSYWVSHNVFSMYQMMFAIITPALIVGAIAERMKFSAILAFVALWMVVVTSRSPTWSGASTAS